MNTERIKMNVIEIRNRKIGQSNEGNELPIEEWEEATVLHRDTTAKDVCREFYPNYKVRAVHDEVPRSLNPKVQDLQRYVIIPQKEKAYDPYAPRYDVKSELIEVPS